MGTLTSGDLGYPGFFQYGATFPPNNGYWDDRQLYFVGLHGGTVASPGGITQMGMWTLEGSKFQIVPDGALGYTGSYFDIEELNDSISHLGPGTCVIGLATVDGLYPAGLGTQALFDEEGWGALPRAGHPCECASPRPRALHAGVVGGGAIGPVGLCVAKTVTT